MVPIVYCLDKNFINYTQISIDSVLRHNKNVRIELIVPEYIDELSQYRQHICSSDKLKKLNVRNYDRITAFTYARLFIPELLSEYDKCLYIDGDIIVRTNMEELLNTDVQYIGAVEETNKDWLLSGVEKDTYYNAGLLLMNLKSLRDDNFSKKCIEYILNYKEKYFGSERTWLHDQTTINILYSEKITKLDKKYNEQLSWNPPTKYHEIEDKETNLHFLTDYNKWNFIKYSIEHYREFNSLCKNNTDVILILSNPKLSITHIDRVIKSILKCSEIYGNFKLHIFAKYRNLTIDRYFDKLEHNLIDINLYDVTKLVYEHSILEYAKNKLDSKYTFIVDENSIISNDAISELIIHSIRFNNTIVFSKSKNISETGKDNNSYNWKKPEIIRTESLFFYDIKNVNALCLTSNFKKFDFTKSKVFPILEFYNHEIINGKHGLSFKMLSWFIINEPINYKKYAMEITFMIKRIFNSIGLYLNYNEALYLNPYINMDIKYMTPNELHEIKLVRRKIESMTEKIKDKIVNVFDSKAITVMFKRL